MSKELLEAKQKRVAELQAAVQRSTNDYQNLVANHNMLLGRLNESQLDLELLSNFCDALTDIPQ